MMLMTGNVMATAAIILVVAIVVAWLIDRNWSRQHAGMQPRKLMRVGRDRR